MFVDEALKKISDFYEQNKAVHLTFATLDKFLKPLFRELPKEEKKKMKATELWEKFSNQFSYVLFENFPRDKRDADKKLYDALCGQTVTAVLFGKESVFLQFMNGTHIWISRGVIKTNGHESFPVPRKKHKKEIAHVV